MYNASLNWAISDWYEDRTHRTWLMRDPPKKNNPVHRAVTNI